MCVCVSQSMKIHETTAKTPWIAHVGPRLVDCFVDAGVVYISDYSELLPRTETLLEQWSKDGIAVPWHILAPCFCRNRWWIKTKKVPWFSQQIDGDDVMSVPKFGCHRLGDAYPNNG